VTIESTDQRAIIVQGADATDPDRIISSGLQGPSGAASDEALRTALGLTGSLQAVKDANASSPLQLSTTGVKITSALQLGSTPATLTESGGKLTISVATTVGGNLNPSTVWRMSVLGDLELLKTGTVTWSSTTSYGGAKDLAISRYHDGSAAWAQISTGQGLVADHVMVGGTSGFRWTQSGSYISARNNADSGAAAVQALYFYASGGPGVLTSVVKAPSNNSTLVLQNQPFTTADHAVDLATGTWTHSTGEGVACAVTPTINASGDSSNVDFLVDRTVIATGSGPQLLADFRIGSVSQFFIGEGFFGGLERSSDPDAPAEGKYVVWLSNGVGKGDDGDLCYAATVGGVTQWIVIGDYSAGAVW
jgi:hypothetical protein